MLGNYQNDFETAYLDYLMVLGFVIKVFFFLTFLAVIDSQCMCVREKGADDIEQMTQGIEPGPTNIYKHIFTLNN